MIRDIPSIKTGTPVSQRLDIPSYNYYDKWVVTLHAPDSSKKVFGYGNTGWVTDVKFSASPTTGFRIATDTNKSPIVFIDGSWKNHKPEEAFKKAQEFINDPEWSQIGYNPYRFSYFYDKADGMPVVNADEVIQIGPLVLGKNVTKANPTDKRFEVNLKDGRTFNFSTGVML